MSIRKTDIVDADIVDALELSSDGYYVFRSGVTVISTTSSTKTVLLDSSIYLTLEDDPVESGDRVRLIGTSGADGYYIIDSILSETSFKVIESIPNSTGGTANFSYRAGAFNVGFDDTNSVNVAHTNVHKAIEDLDKAIVTISGSALTTEAHSKLRQLIHLADGAGGPFEGFLSGAYREITPSASPFPTSIIWYDDYTKTKKIVEKSISYNANKSISSILWKVYDTDGSTVLATVSDSISYNGIFETNRTRSIS